MDSEDDAGAAGDEGAVADAAPSSGDSDGMAGVAVPGYPGLRAGHPDGDGVLRLYRAPDDQGGDARVIPAAYYGLGQGSGTGNQDGSWRQNDPEANTYDLYQKQRQLNDAKMIAEVLGGGGIGQTVAGAAAKGARQLGFGGLSKFFGAVAEPYTAVAGL